MKLKLQFKIKKYAHVMCTFGFYFFQNKPREYTISSGMDRSDSGCSSSSETLTGVIRSIANNFMKIKAKACNDAPNTPDMP